MFGSLLFAPLVDQLIRLHSGSDRATLQRPALVTHQFERALCLPEALELSPVSAADSDKMQCPSSNPICFIPFRTIGSGLWREAAIFRLER